MGILIFCDRVHASVCECVGGRGREREGITNARIHAVTPVPQEVITGLSNVIPAVNVQSSVNQLQLTTQQFFSQIDGKNGQTA